MPEQERSAEELAAAQEQAKKELLKLGLEANKENIEAILALRETPQHPAGFEAILDNLDNPEELKKAMQEKVIHNVIHSEGKTVWDHVRLSVELIDAMDIPDDQKRMLKVIMLFHDMGKTEVGGNEENVTATAKKVAKGELHQSMIGHAEAKQDVIRAGLAANGLDGNALDLAMIVIQNHMKTSLLEQDPKKTVKLFETFGANDEERRTVVELLTSVLQLDGNATGHIDLVDGELVNSKNEKKLQLNFAAVWAKYEQGRGMMGAEDEKKKKAEAERASEVALFGKPMSDYVRVDRGIAPGPAMGKALKKIQGVMAANRGLEPTDLKRLIDETPLE